VEAYPIMQQHWTLGRQIVRERETTLLHPPLNAPNYKHLTEQYVSRQTEYIFMNEKYEMVAASTLHYMCHATA
jgi:hypothetical protein